MRRLRVRTAAHLRVSTSANVVSKKRGMLARQYRRSSENGDYWRLELIYLALARRNEVPSPSSALLRKFMPGQRY